MDLRQGQTLRGADVGCKTHFAEAEGLVIMSRLVSQFSSIPKFKDEQTMPFTRNQTEDRSELHDLVYGWGKIGSSQNRVGRFESLFEGERVRTGPRSPHLTWSSESRETPATKKTWLDFRRHDSGVRRHQATGPGGSQHQGLLNPWRTVGVDNAYRVASSSSSNRFYRAGSN